MTGLILVFDLDQTLIDSNSFAKIGNWNHIDKYLNMDLVNTILKPAVRLRENKAGVDAIFLLSNNGSSDYVLRVIYSLSFILGVDNLFDYVMIRTHSSRPRSENPPKRLSDVKYMLEHALTPIYYSDKVNQKIYIFDDYTKHQIRKELPDDHYIEIRGPDVDIAGNNMGFITGKSDLSDYRKIKHVLDTLESRMKSDVDPPQLILNDNSDSVSLKKSPFKEYLNGGSRKKRKCKTKCKTRKRF